MRRESERCEGTTVSSVRCGTVFYKRSRDFYVMLYFQLLEFKFSLNHAAD